MNTKWMTEGEFWVPFGTHPETGRTDIANGQNGTLLIVESLELAEQICDAHNASVDVVVERAMLQAEAGPHGLIYGAIDIRGRATTPDTEMQPNPTSQLPMLTRFWRLFS